MENVLGYGCPSGPYCSLDSYKKCLEQSDSSDFELGHAGVSSHRHNTHRPWCLHFCTCRDSGRGAYVSEGGMKYSSMASIIARAALINTARDITPADLRRRSDTTLPATRSNSTHTCSLRGEHSCSIQASGKRAVPLIVMFWICSRSVCSSFAFLNEQLM